MPHPALGQELEVVGDELHNPALVSKQDLERAGQVLEALGGAVDNLKKGLDQDAARQQLVEAITEAERLYELLSKASGGTVTAVLREVGEKCLSLAQAAMEESGDIDLPKELPGLVSMLQGLVEKYPEPKKPDYPAAKSELESSLLAVAEQALATSQKVATAKAVTGELGVEVETVASTLGALVEKFSISKGETTPVLPDISEETEEAEAQATAMTQTLREVADRAASLAKMATSETPSDAVKTEIGALRDLVEAAKERCPMQTAKAAGTFSSTLREVSERALSLASKAKSAGFEQAKAAREIKTLSTLLKGLLDKYPDVKKAEEAVAPELSDLSLALDIDQRLAVVEEEFATFETAKRLETEKIAADVETARVEAEKAGLATCPECGKPMGFGKFCQNCGVERAKACKKPAKKDDGEIDPPAAVTEPVITPPAAVTEPPITTPPVVAAPVIDAPIAPTVDELAKRLDTAVAQVAELQTQIAKARSEVTPPASTGDEGGGEGEGNTDPLLFPRNYNDPAYREQLAKRESK